MKVIIKPAEDDAMIQLAKKLFLEYAESLNFNLCFQNFEKEVAGLPGDYAEPDGRLLLLYYGDLPVGCVALRKVVDKISEIKRLYVMPKYRGKGFGRKLALEVIRQAKEIGYERMKLDTIPSMKEAIALYHELGFKEVSAYRYNPVEDAIYMELDLQKRRSE
ncbi:MAG: GNAT family N-acetyltransferase [Ignavibacteriales bacterium]|nr:GNAT family N-acetyltransferase [Ignavibacteriales bacterium]